MRRGDPPRPKRVLVIANPVAGRRRQGRLAAILAILRDRGCDLSVQTTSARGDAERMARAIDDRHADVIAIAGGDGTINEVLNGLGPTAPPVAIIPIGTANVLAAEIGLPATTYGIADAVAFGHPRRISLGLANGRRFAVMASIGLDAEVVRHVNLTLKRYLGKGAYTYETLYQWLRFEPTVYDLSLDGQHRQAHGVVIANGRYFGGRFIVAPDACIEEPSFDICCCTSAGRIAAFRYLASMVRGNLASRRDYEIIKGMNIQIHGPEGAAVQADGDVITRLPATISMLPNAVALMFPEHPPNHVEPSSSPFSKPFEPKSGEGDR